MKILLIFPPFSVPTVMPYSITRMQASLSSQFDENISVLDLNALFHKEEFHDYYKRKESGEEYFGLLKEFINEARHRYSKISKGSVLGKLPDFHNRLMQEIYKNKPDIAALSLVYNSQVFFTKWITDALIKKGIDVVIGGPADTSKIRSGAEYLADYNSLSRYLAGKGAHKTKRADVIDFSSYDPPAYFTKEIIYPLKTADSCPYKRCAFCTHHGNKKYTPFDLNSVKSAVISNKMKKIYFIDDDFPLKRLERLSGIMSALNVEWSCQLRPVKEIIPLLAKLSDSGLRAVSWGVESGSQRILDLMEKGTDPADISKVLKASRKNRIRNIVHIMFGFPSETEQEFMATIKFLEENSGSVDLISPSIFGLQRSSRIFQNPSCYSIDKIWSSPRTLLGDTINYKTIRGMGREKVRQMKAEYLPLMNMINKVPRIINACKEQILNY